MKRTTLILLTTGLLASALSTAPAQSKSSGLDWLKKKSGLSEEPGAIDVESLLPEPVKLKVLRQAPIYYQLDLSRRLGTMPAGSVVEVIALSEKDIYKVRGKAFHDEVSGWMRAEDLAAKDPAFVTNLRAMADRQRLVAQLVQNHEIALGMSRAEVEASLGAPNRTSNRLDAGGQQTTLEYITYQRVPQRQTKQDPYGRLYNTVVYVKVETGRLSVALKDDVVASIDETEGNPLGDAGAVKIVPAPIAFAF